LSLPYTVNWNFVNKIFASELKATKIKRQKFKKVAINPEVILNDKNKK